jgi:prepilin-type N-terminal cleavage/methylation domain-containing protein
MQSGERGFTLIELMVVVTIISVLAAVAIPIFRGHMQEARIGEAKPYLMEIAARQRSYKARNGVYCCSGDILDESNTGPKLGVETQDTGNFCFAVICRSSSLCANTTSTNFVSSAESGDPSIEFEVWAILRASTGTTVSGPGGATCRMAAAKRSPTGWVAASSSSSAAREGRVAVLRYPAPLNGRDSVSGINSVRFNWLEGVSITHALTQ